jgi:hypothetical protein
VKKVKVKMPNGRTLVVIEYETDIGADTTAAEYARQLDEEKGYDRKLDELAGEAADRIDAAERGDRALEYWLVGRLIIEHERQLDEKAKQAGLREYEAPGRSRQRLMEKVKDIRQERGAKKDQYSVHYLRKFARHAQLLTQAQASRPVHYSLQHELLYDWLTKEDRDDLLSRCERGEFKSNTDLRRAVAALRQSRELDAHPRSDQTDDSATSRA